MKVFNALFLSLLSAVCFAQKTFEINLTAKDNIDDSIYFSAPPPYKLGFENIYKFYAEGENVSEPTDPGFAPNTAYIVLIKDENIIRGTIEYPIRVYFLYIDMETGSFGAAKPFWLDSGIYSIDLPRLQGPVVVPVNTPADLE